VRSQGGERKVFFASLTFHQDTIDEVVKLVAVTVVGDINTVVTGATNGHVTKAMPENGRSERKPAFRTHKGTCVEDTLFPGTNGLDLLFHSTGSAQVSSKLAVRRVFSSRVAAVAFELHLNDDVVHQTTAGDTCLLMAGVTVTAKDVAASTLQGP